MIISIREGENTLPARLSQGSGIEFWYLISEDKDLYTDIIEPIGHKAREHNIAFELQKSRIINRFTRSFVEQFCDAYGNIDWMRLVAASSGNYDLDEYLP